MRPLARPLVPVFVAVLLSLTSQPSYAQNYTWSATTGGSWTDGTNWGSTPGDYPSTSGNRAFLSSAGNGSDKFITLDTAITLRRLVFNSNQTGSVTIAPGTGGSLTLDSIETGQPTLDLQPGTGNHTIAADLTLVGPIAHKWNIAADQTLIVSGSIAGTQGLTKLQAGTLLLNGTNTYTGPTLVSAGALGGHGSIASPVTLAAGTTISAGTSSSMPALTLNNGLSLSGRYLATLYSASVASELVLPSGVASIGGGSLELGLAPGLTVADMRAAGPRSFTIIDASGGQLSGTFTSTDFTTAGFFASEWAITYDTVNGNVILSFTPVPEPATVLGIAGAGLISACLIRRRALRSTGMV